MPSEFYLIIFLLVAVLVFVYFYAKRAKGRGNVQMTKVHDDNAATTESTES